MFILRLSARKVFDARRASMVSVSLNLHND